MNKELQKLLNQINAKKNEVKNHVNDGNLDKAKTAKEELKELQNKFDLLYDLEEDKQGDIEDKVNKGTAKQVGGEKAVDKKAVVKAFVNIVKAGFMEREANEADIKVYKNALTSDTTAGSEGEVGIGLTIPEDIRTEIYELRRSEDNLEQYVNTEPVVTKSGMRNIEVDAETTPFDNVDEAADFPEMDEPKFLPVEYKVKKKGGILKMTAELFEDTAENIMKHINKSGLFMKRVVFTMILAAFIFTVVMIVVFLRVGSEPSTLIENVFRFLSVEGGAMALIKSVKTVKGKSNGESNIHHMNEPEQGEEE